MSVRPLIPELAEKARIKFQEDPEKLQNALQEVKDWLALQPHIHARTDDQWLAGYIRGCKFDLKKVKTKLDLFYTCRLTARELCLMHHQDDKFRTLLNSGFYLPLPKLTDPAGPRVYLVRLDAVDYVNIGVIPSLAAAHVIEKIIIMDDDNTMIAESIVIVDFKNVNLIHIMQATPIQLKMIIASQQDAVPFATLAVVVINIPPGFDALLNMIKKLFDDDVAARWYFYGEDSVDYSIHGITQDILPVEYGGSGGTIREITDYWVQKVNDYSEWLEEDLQFGTDESKRPGGPLSAETMFGQTSHFQILEAFGVWEKK